MKNDPFDFTYHLGDNELSVEAKITSEGRDTTYADLKGPGEPGEAPEAEILMVHLIEPKIADDNSGTRRKMLPFSTEAIFIRPWAKSKMVFLQDALEEAAIESWENSQ
jgi:hypothetical protein